MGKFRMFAGKRYRDLGRGYSAKSEAKHEANKLRKKGKKTRVVKKGNSWWLYGRG